MPVENLEHTKPDVTHFHVFGCGAYVFLLEKVHHNKLSPKSELMTFIGYPQGINGYLFMRSPNNVLFTAVQALFNETLYPKCPNMHRPGYTPVSDPPVGKHGEYNIPPDDENDDFGVVTSVTLHKMLEEDPTIGHSTHHQVMLTKVHLRQWKLPKEVWTCKIVICRIQPIQAHLRMTEMICIPWR